MKLVTFRFLGLLVLSNLLLVSVANASIDSFCKSFANTKWDIFLVNPNRTFSVNVQSVSGPEAGPDTDAKYFYPFNGTGFLNTPGYSFCAHYSTGGIDFAFTIDMGQGNYTTLYTPNPIATDTIGVGNSYQLISNSSPSITATIVRK